jgi:hypothetical protein
MEQPRSLPPDPMSGPPLPPGEGVLWLKASLRFFQMEALRWIALAAAFGLIAQLAAIIPSPLSIGALIMPGLVVGFLAAAWHQERAQRPELSHLLFGLKSNVKALLLIGVVCAVWALIAGVVTTKVTGIDLAKLVSPTQQTFTAEIARSYITWLSWSALFMIPLNLALWFAPALVVFDDLDVVEALKRSLIASLRNFAAMLVFCLAFAGLLIAMVVIAMLVQVISPAIARVLLLMCVLPATAIALIAGYISYRRVFHPNQPLRLP